MVNFSSFYLSSNKYYKYFPNLSEKQLEHFELLFPLYTEWNEKINVISRKDIDNLMLHHVLHSLAIAKFVDFKPGTEILDVGTGGGFPGLAMAIAFPQAQLTLVDSVGRKTQAVEAMATALGLSDRVQLRCERVELTGRHGQCRGRQYQGRCHDQAMFV